MMARSSGVTFAMVVTELLDQGLNTLSKAAMTRGMSSFVFVAYSNILGLFILIPTCLLFYRKRVPPKLTRSILFRIFLLSLLGCCVQLIMWVGIGYSSPTLSSVMSDLTPAFTYILAIISRMERLDLRAQSSLAKVIGTVVSITGALMVTLYKGLPLTNASSRMPQQLLSPVESNWVFGGFLLACAAFLLSLLFIVQTWIVREYPSELMMAFIGCFFVIIESTAVALVVERGHPSVWTLRPGLELIAIAYSACFASVMRCVVTAWACRTKGPLFVAMFKPLGMVFATVLGVSLLGDILYLGSIFGALVIVMGFYAVIWGKAQEEDMLELGIGSSTKEPLLQ